MQLEAASAGLQQERGLLLGQVQQLQAVGQELSVSCRALEAGMQAAIRERDGLQVGRSARVLQLCMASKVLRAMAWLGWPRSSPPCCWRVVCAGSALPGPVGARRRGAALGAAAAAAGGQPGVRQRPPGGQRGQRAEQQGAGAGAAGTGGHHGGSRVRIYQLGSGALVNGVTPPPSFTRRTPWHVPCRWRPCSGTCWQASRRQPPGSRNFTLSSRWWRPRRQRRARRPGNERRRRPPPRQQRPRGSRSSCGHGMLSWRRRAGRRRCWRRSSSGCRRRCGGGGRSGRWLRGTCSCRPAQQRRRLPSWSRSCGQLRARQRG